MCTNDPTPDQPTLLPVTDRYLQATYDSQHALIRFAVHAMHLIQRPATKDRTLVTEAARTAAATTSGAADYFEEFATWLEQQPDQTEAGE